MTVSRNRVLGALFIMMVLAAVLLAPAITAAGSGPGAQAAPAANAAAWEMQNPPLHPYQLRGVWGSSASNVFAVGESGTVMRYGGGTWSQMTSGTTYNLNGIWGSSASNIFAVGDHGTIRRFNGSAWTGMNTGTATNLNAVWGSSASNVFAVGDSGMVLRYNGSSWSSVSTGTASSINGIWGSSASNVLVVDSYGSIRRYNGSSWSLMEDVDAVLYGLWGSSSASVFAVGSGGLILHYDGSSWTAMASEETLDLHGVWGSSSSNVFAVGDTFFFSALRYNGSQWSGHSQGSGLPILGVWGASSSNVFAVGCYGSIHHFDGADWTLEAGGLGDDLVGIWGSSPSNVFAVESLDALIGYDGTGWGVIEPALPPYAMDVDWCQNGIWGASGADLFIVGQRVDWELECRCACAWHWDGMSWTCSSLDDATSPAGESMSTAIWGSGPSDVFAVGWGVSDPLGARGMIFHYDGSAWAPMSPGNSPGLAGVWGSSSTSVFAVGASGTVLRYNGTTWAAMSSGTTADLAGVWCSSSSSVFAVGASGTILRYNGSTWTAMSSGCTADLTGIWGSSATDVYAVGSGGTVLHYDGSTWSAMDSGTVNDLAAVWGSATDVFAVGEGCTILHRRIGNGPAAPVLVSPANGSTIFDRTPYLDWSKVTAATTVHYQLQVDNNRDFSSPAVSRTWVSYSYYTVTTTLSLGTYYWRVRAVDASGNVSAWTDPWSFTVATRLPAVPTLVSPANGAVTTDHTPYLDWSKVTASSTVHYQVQVDNNADFSSPAVSKTWVSYSYYTVGTSLSHGTYYWRVRAVDASGNRSAWTAPWSFRVA